MGDGIINVHDFNSILVCLTWYVVNTQHPSWMGCPTCFFGMLTFPCILCWSQSSDSSLQPEGFKDHINHPYYQVSKLLRFDNFVFVAWCLTILFAGLLLLAWLSDSLVCYSSCQCCCQLLIACLLAGWLACLLACSLACLLLPACWLACWPSLHPDLPACLPLARRIVCVCLARPVCLSVCLSACLSACLSVCLLVFLLADPFDSRCASTKLSEMLLPEHALTFLSKRGVPRRKAQCNDCLSRTVCYGVLLPRVLLQWLYGCTSNGVTWTKWDPPCSEIRCRSSCSIKIAINWRGPAPILWHF